MIKSFDKDGNISEGTVDYNKQPAEGLGGVNVSDYADPTAVQPRQDDSALKRGPIGGQGVAFDPAGEQVTGVAEPDTPLNQVMGTLPPTGDEDTQLDKFGERKRKEAADMHKPDDYKPGVTEQNIDEVPSLSTTQGVAQRKGLGH